MPVKYGEYQKPDFQKWDKNAYTLLTLLQILLECENKASNIARRAELGRVSLKIFIDEMIT